MHEDWLVRLKRAYDAGYYRTEAAVGLQTRFPWQDKTCKDCPFWQKEICTLYRERRSALAHTCVQFNAAPGVAAVAAREHRLRATTETSGN